MASRALVEAAAILGCIGAVRRRMGYYTDSREHEHVKKVWQEYFIFNREWS
jgi:hypothetical protein